MAPLGEPHLKGGGVVFGSGFIKALGFDFFPIHRKLPHFGWDQGVAFDRTRITHLVSDGFGGQWPINELIAHIHQIRESTLKRSAARRRAKRTFVKGNGFFG